MTGVRYKNLCFFLLLVILQSPLFLSAQKSFGGIIYTPSRELPGLSESVNDMAYWLSKASNSTFEIKTGTQDDGSGIRLQLVEQAGLPADMVKQITSDNQSFYLKINGTHSVLIAGTGINSFRNGIYTFLQELGFRWYMPGDNWVIIPQMQNLKLNISKVYSPDFQNRYYFGTGGIRAIPGLDDKNTFKKDFDNWNQRNRFGSDFAGHGHRGQVFYREKKNELDKHPEYFCNNKVNQFGRINIANPKVVDLFVEWALSEVNRQDRFPVIGVDPADGSGGKDDCLPVGMAGIKTWSDKYFWLANKVAEKLKADTTGIKVQIYAYSSHAAPPSFEINPKVYPIIIPYAFQRVADPEQFIKKWHEKLEGRPMGVYDYWNITQWSVDVPQFNIFTISKKINLWKEHSINTIRLESTNAKGPMGHALWIAAQMMWNAGLSFDSLYNEFLNQCFGPAAADIKRMYDRWSLNYQGATDVSFSLNDLSRASAKTTDAAIQKRISELKAYVVYLKMYYDYQQDPSPAGYNELIKYIYSIHHLRVLQTYALQDHYIQLPKGYIKGADMKKIKSENELIKDLSFDNIEKKFKQALLANPIMYNLSGFSFDIQKAFPPKKSTTKFYSPTLINGRNSYQFYLPDKRKVNIQAGGTKETRFVIKDSDEKVWVEKIIRGSKEGYETVQIELPAGKYVFSYGELYHFSRFIFPKDIPLFSSHRLYNHYQYPLHYAYVPKDATEIIYRDNIGPNKNKRGFWIDPDGKPVKPVKLKFSIYHVPVPPQHRGKVWALNIAHRHFQLLNIPNIFSLNDFEYKE